MKIGPELIELARLRGFKVQNLELQGCPDIIVFQRKASSGTAPKVYLSSGIHGDEPAGPLAVLELLEEDALSGDLDWTLFPLLNPWGVENGKRENQHGIDLNRDYNVRQSREIRAHVNWLEQYPTPYDLYLSLHEDWETTGFYLYEINTSKHPSLALPLLQVAETILPLEKGPEVDGHKLNRPGLIAHRDEPDEPDGWPEAIYICKRTPLRSYTFETPSSAPLDLRVAIHKACTLRSQQILFHENSK